MAPSPAPPSLLQQTCTNLRHTLARSVAGIPAEQLCCDYRNMVGEGIPFRRLGFESLGSFLGTIPEICSIRRLPSGGMLVAQPGQGEGQNSRIANYKQSRNFPKPKKTIRRPNQQSTNWIPPQQGNFFPSGPPSLTGWQRTVPGNLHTCNTGTAGRGAQLQRDIPRKPLREPKLSREGSQTQLRREGSQTQPRREGNDTQSRSGGIQTQTKRSQVGDAKQPGKNYRSELQSYFSKKNLGTANYKIATLGSKGKERFMATVFVEQNQYKTYPETYPTQLEAEEALANIVISKLGITGEREETGAKETKDLLQYAQRVVALLGERFNGVWSHQVENEYYEKFEEKLPGNWIEKMEEVNQIRIESPIPDSVRFIIFPISQDFFSNLPPTIFFPEDDIWEVFVTIVRSTRNISLRIIGSAYSEMFDNLISDMDLHYFDKSCEAAVPEPVVGKLYAAQVSSDWHRVKIVSVTMETCSCLFIDHGDEDTILKEDLRELSPKFLLVPPQVMMVEVAGLQEYQHSEAIVNQLNQRLLGKSLAAKVENRSKFGKRLTPETSELPRLIFFDTSMEEEDVNINQKLIELIVSEGSETRLPKPGQEEIKVTLSFIMASGDIYVRKEAKVKIRNSQAPEGDLAILKEDTSSERKAIKCRLDGVPPPGHTWSPSATEALRELVPEDQVVTLKVVREEDGCPYVELNLPHSNDGSINFDLSTEFDIFPLAPCEMIKNDTNNNKDELKPIKEESENEVTDNNPNSGSFDHISLKTLLSPQIPQKGSYFDLTVTFAVSPDSFVIQPHNQGNTFSTMMADMANFYSSAAGKELSCVPIELDVAKEKYFAGQLAGGVWHRVEVSNFIPCGDSSQAIVRYVDQGSSAMLLVSDLHPLHGQFRNLPCQAVAAGLAGLSPAGGQREWTPEDNYWFNHRVAGKMFVGRVMEHSSKHILVELVDTSHPTEDHYIHKQLIMDGRAEARK